MMKGRKYLLLLLCCAAIALTCRKKTDDDEIQIPSYYENITNDTLQAAMACIGIDGQDNLYVVWKGLPWTGPYGYDSADIYFSMKSPSGSWSTPIEISGHKKICDAPSMVVDDAGNVHVVWLEYYGFFKIFYRMRNSSGEWQAIEVIIDSDGHHADLPYLTADNGGGIHLTWSGMNAIMYMYKSPGGEWEAPQSIPCGWGLSGNPVNTEIDDNDNMHCVLQDGGFFSDIWYTMKKAGGSWGEMTDLSHNPDQTCWMSRLAVDREGTVHAIWHGYNWEDNGVYYTDKVTGGNWSSPVCIFDGYGHGQICADKSCNLHLFFSAADTATGSKDIFYGVKSDDGTWAEYVNITQTPGNSLLGLCRNIAIDSYGDLHLIWEEDTGGENNWDILYKKIERRE